MGITIISILQIIFMAMSIADLPKTVSLRLELLLIRQCRTEAFLQLILQTKVKTKIVERCIVREILLKNKLQTKHRKSNTSDKLQSSSRKKTSCEKQRKTVCVSSEKHQRTDSKASKKSKKSSKKFNKHLTPALNGYLNVPKIPIDAFKHPLLYSNLLNSGVGPSQQSSYIINKLPSQSPFLSKISNKSKNSRNDNIGKSNSTAFKSQNSQLSLKMQNPRKEVKVSPS